jgi:hypothetical protein
MFPRSQALPGERTTREALPPGREDNSPMASGGMRRSLEDVRSQAEPGNEAVGGWHFPRKLKKYHPAVS